jgi:hypothetical protein
MNPDVDLYQDLLLTANKDPYLLLLGMIISYFVSLIILLLSWLFLVLYMIISFECLEMT